MYAGLLVKVTVADQEAADIKGAMTVGTRNLATARWWDFISDQDRQGRTIHAVVEAGSNERWLVCTEKMKHQPSRGSAMVVAAVAVGPAQPPLEQIISPQASHTISTDTMVTFFNLIHST